MSDAMLTELYERAFNEKRICENESTAEGNENRRMIAIAKNKLLCELIDIRTEHIRGMID